MFTKTQRRTLWIATTALLAALIIVLQALSTVIHFGPVNITLALTPIIIGAAIFGWKTGMFLGFIFSLVVFILGITGADGGFVLLMMDHNAFFTVVICLLKGTAAGAVAGLVYRPLAKKPLLATLAASAATPIVNTGLFALAMVTIFFGFLSGMAGDSNPIGFLLTAFIGINFLVEFAVNMLLGTTLSRIIGIYQKKFSVKFK